MRAKRCSLAAALSFIVLAYVAYPYVTLYRIGHAIHTGDARALQTLVDWHSVRAGIKRDISEQIARNPQAVAGNALPAFGASFVRHATANAVDRHVTPQGLVTAARRGPAPSEAGGAGVHVAWAFFNDPTHFAVTLHAGHQPRPIRLELTLHDTEWRVTRVWLPHDLLDEANSRT